MVPILQTERLTLRGWKLEDFRYFANFWADPDRTRFFISGVQNESQSWTAFCAMVGEWNLRDFGMFAIQQQHADLPVGHAGIWFPPDIDEPELAWSLYKGNEGNGFATEAANRIIEWARSSFGWGPLMSFVHPENTASIAVAKRLGAVVESETTLRGDPRLVFRHAQPT